MSPRAAWRLESLGFDAAFDYVAGKNDWTARGLPTEGSYAHIPRAGPHAQAEGMTCAPDDRIDALRQRMDDAAEKVAIVVTPERVVLGRVRRKYLDERSGIAAGDVMDPGPATVRYDEYLPDLVERMKRARVGSILVTDPGGKLLGIMRRTEAEEFLQRLQEEHAHHHHEHES